MPLPDRPYWTVWVEKDERPVTVAGAPGYLAAIRFSTIEGAQERADALNQAQINAGSPQAACYQVRTHSEKIRIQRRIHPERIRPA